MIIKLIKDTDRIVNKKLKAGKKVIVTNRFGMELIDAGIAVGMKKATKDDFMKLAGKSVGIKEEE